MGQSLIIGLGKGGSVEGIYLGLSKRPRDKHGRYLRPRASWGPCLLEVVFRVGKDPPAFDLLGLSMLLKECWVTKTGPWAEAAGESLTSRGCLAPAKSPA